MKNYDHIPLTVHQYEESMYQWNQDFLVPAGWDYMTDSDLTFRTAPRDLTISLSCRGDWLEIVNEALSQRILYAIC